MAVLISIGKWTLTEKELFCKNPDYVINVERLSESYHPGEIYNWPEHLAAKTWMSEIDIYQFNTIFLFALEHFKIPLDTRSWKETILNQQSEMSRYRSF